MATDTTSLYETLGGKGQLEFVVDAFYHAVLEDDRINHHFKTINVENLKAHQLAFISQVLGGPKQYSGRSMAEAHAGLNLTAADFNATAQHLVAALEKAKVSQIHIDEVMSKIAKLEREIIHK